MKFSFNVGLLGKKIIILSVIGIGCVALGISLSLKYTSPSNNEIVDKENNDLIIEEDNKIDEEETNNNISNNDENKIYDENGKFLFAIDEVTIDLNRGVLEEGTIERGKVKVGDTVQIVGLGKEKITTTVSRILINDNDVQEAKAGDFIKVSLNNISEKDIIKGQVLVEENSINDVINFKAEIYMFATEEGGRKTAIKTNYHPQFFFRNIDVSGMIELLNGVDLVKPGEKAIIKAKLYTPLPMEVGSEFKLMEGRFISGKGIVTEIYN